jgi:hypothetical protein
LAGSKLGGWFRNLCSPIKPSIQVWKNAINIQNCVGQTHQNLICQKFHSTVYWRIRLSPNIRQCLFLSYGINLLNTKVINMCMWFNWKPTYVCSLHFLNPSKLFTCKRSSCFNWMEWIQKERLSEWKRRTGMRVPKMPDRLLFGLQSLITPPLNQYINKSTTPISLKQ